MTAVKTEPLEDRIRKERLIKMSKQKKKRNIGRYEILHDWKTHNRKIILEK